jgi:CheY-like chemotaxis protein
MSKNPTILIADDNKTIRIVMRRMLEKKGYKHIIEVEDGLTAFQVMKTQKIDVVIADWHMEGLSGIELLQRIREDSHIGDTPFIMVSVEGLDVSLDAAFKYGVSDFVSKPFTADILLESLEKVMQQARS